MRLRKTEDPARPDTSNRLTIDMGARQLDVEGARRWLIETLAKRLNERMRERHENKRLAG